MSLTPEAREALDKILANHAAQIMEHFDSVVIICTKVDTVANETARIAFERGNWYANAAAVFETANVKNDSMTPSIAGDDDEA
jgi:hypothetical protein